MKKRLVGLMLGAVGLMLVACASQENDNDASGADVSQENDVVFVEVDEIDAPLVSDIEAIESDAQESEDIVIDDSEDEIYEGMGMFNPWVDSDEAGVLEATGFDLVAPSEAANVIYSYMPSEGMAQMNYNLDNAMWVYRIQSTEALEDISGIYCEWNYTGETKIAGMDAMEYIYASEPEDGSIDNIECVRVINWYDAQKKVTYSLSVLGTNLDGMDTAVYAENLYNLTANN